MLAARTFKGSPVTARVVRLNGREPHVRVANFATRTRRRAQNCFVRPHVSPLRTLGFKYRGLLLSCKNNVNRHVETPEGSLRSGEGNRGDREDAKSINRHLRFTPESRHVRCNCNVGYGPIADIPSGPSITTSAVASSAGEIARPSPLAVFTLKRTDAVQNEMSAKGQKRTSRAIRSLHRPWPAAADETAGRVFWLS